MIQTFGFHLKKNRLKLDRFLTKEATQITMKMPETASEETTVELKTVTQIEANQLEEMVDGNFFNFRT